MLHEHSLYISFVRFTMQSTNRWKISWGQRAFYFSNEFLENLFKENGFKVEEIGLCCKQVENRSRELIMNRYLFRTVLSSTLPRTRKVFIICLFAEN